jgi:NADPH2:quinone reductase
MKTMKAMVLTEFGGLDKLEFREMPIPQPGPMELLVRVHATSVNPVDLKLRQNGSWAGIVPPAVLGADVSGVVEEVGEGVTDFATGDEVYYTPEISGGQGSYAEYHVVDEAIVAQKPTNLSHVEAAAIPLAGGTAWTALMERAGVSLGETVLVHGVGGVGSMAVQIASAAGARVLATCGYYMLNDAEALGVYQAINYESDDFVSVVQEATEGAGADVVLDTVGGDLLARSIEVTRPFGRLVSIVSTDAGFSAGNAKNLTVHLVFLQRERSRLVRLSELIERGQLRPVIDSVMPLTDVPKAHRRLEAGGVKGKIVLNVSEI